MKKRINLFHPLLIFILMQIAWISLLALWIYWYSSNYLLIKQAGERFLPQFINVSTRTQLFTLIFGLVLLILLLGGMYFVFIYLTRQININLLYENFIANFTHELKSPLASIQLYLETLHRSNVSEEIRQEFLERMLMDTQRLKRIIDAILDISQIEQKKKLYNLELYPADKIVKELIKECQHQFKISPEQIKISGKISGKWAVDRDAMLMVFANLIDNALKYTSGELQLSIRLRQKNNQMILEFSDNGIGIDPEEQKRIFQKFYRISVPHKPDIRGTGLGLYMAREIVRGHGGKISVTSEGLNKGTTFILTFPLRAEKDRTKSVFAKPLNIVKRMYKK